MKDKKKMIVLGLLALAIVGVGAFQFMGGPSRPLVASVDKKVSIQPTASPSADAPKNPGVAQPLPERDPFNVPKEAQPSAAPTIPTPPPTTASSGRDRPRGTERIPPVIDGHLPYPGGPLETGPIGQGGTPPVMVPEPAFAYQVVGVMVGSRPCAVFADAQGNQRLVPLGGSIDPETKVTGIEKGKVTLSHRGKTLHFEVGGNPNAK